MILKSIRCLLLSVINTLCPGVVFLYFGRPLKAFIFSIIAIIVVVAVCYSGLVFCSLGPLVIPLSVMVLAFIAALFSDSLDNDKSLKRHFLKKITLCALYCIFWIFLLVTILYYKKTVLGFDVYQVASDSMLPTLATGDYVLADTRFELKNNIRRFDVVFFKRSKSSSRVYIKRVYDFGEYFTKIERARKLSSKFKYPKRITVPKLGEKELYLVGDNLNASFDSRNFGPISSENIVAIAKRVYREGRWRVIATSID